VSSAETSIAVALLELAFDGLGVVGSLPSIVALVLLIDVGILSLPSSAAMTADVGWTGLELRLVPSMKSASSRGIGPVELPRLRMYLALIFEASAAASCGGLV